MKIHIVAIGVFLIQTIVYAQRTDTIIYFNSDSSCPFIVPLVIEKELATHPYYFKEFEACTYDSFMVFIFSGTGEVIFTSIDPQVIWNGEGVSSGYYTWRLSVFDRVDGRKKVAVGRTYVLK